MLADIVGKRKVEERLAKTEVERDAAQAERDKAEADLAAAQAEVERLRRLIESNGSN